MSECLFFIEALDKGLVENSLDNFTLFLALFVVRVRLNLTFLTPVLYFFKDVEILDNIKDELRSCDESHLRSCLRPNNHRLESLDWMS